MMAYYKMNKTCHCTDRLWLKCKNKLRTKKTLFLTNQKPSPTKSFGIWFFPQAELWKKSSTNLKAVWPTPWTKKETTTGSLAKSHPPKMLDLPELSHSSNTYWTKNESTSDGEWIPFFFRTMNSTPHNLCFAVHYNVPCYYTLVYNITPNAQVSSTCWIDHEKREMDDTTEDSVGICKLVFCKC